MSNEITYFEGEEGYYYNPISNDIWLIKNKIKEKYINIKTMSTWHVYKYDVSVSGTFLHKQVVVMKNFEQALFLSDWRDDE